MMKGTKEYNWMKHQSSSGPAGSDAKIKKEDLAGIGSTLFSGGLFWRQLRFGGN